jgi:hypothetical protein
MAQTKGEFDCFCCCWHLPVDLATTDPKHQTHKWVTLNFVVNPILFETSSLSKPCNVLSHTYWKLSRLIQKDIGGLGLVPNECATDGKGEVT